MKNDTKNEKEFYVVQIISWASNNKKISNELFKFKFFFEVFTSTILRLSFFDINYLKFTIKQFILGI